MNYIGKCFLPGANELFTSLSSEINYYYKMLFMSEITIV